MAQPAPEVSLVSPPVHIGRRLPSLVCRLMLAARTARALSTEEEREGGEGLGEQHLRLENEK